MKALHPFTGPIHKDFRTKTRTHGFKVTQLGGHGGHQSKKAPVHGRNEGLFHNRAAVAALRDGRRQVDADVLNSARLNLKAAGRVETVPNMIRAIEQVYARRRISGL